jgi:hypothetical protein
MAFSTLRRKISLRDSYAAKIIREGNPPQKPRKPLPRSGKRSRKRQEMNAKLNGLDIQHCEIRRPGCWGRNGLTWAHARKSRFLVTDADWLTAARACISCHNAIEALSHSEMERIITEAIAKRQ